MVVAFTNCSLPIFLKIVCFVKLVFPHIVSHGIGFGCKFILLMDMFVSNVNSTAKAMHQKCFRGNVTEGWKSPEKEIHG